MSRPALPWYCGLVLLLALSSAGAETAPYALLAPAVVARLPQAAATPEAQAIVRAANGALAKPPHPLPVAHVEGTHPQHGIYDETLAAQRDWPAMLNFALAYRLTADPRYLPAEETYFSGWLRTYRLSLNPIDETNLDQVIMAFDAAGTELTPGTRQAMGSFLRAIAEGYLERIARERTEDNANWQSHRIKLITLAAYALGDPVLVERARRAFARQLSVNIRPDGSVVDFAKRDALHYVVYDLEPLTVAALAAQAHGADWFHPAAPGAPAVSRALDWLSPYALGERVHQEFVHSSVKFDAERAAAGLKGYAGPWAPATSVYLYQLASLADPAYRPVLDHLAQAAGVKPPAWLLVLARAGL